MQEPTEKPLKDYQSIVCLFSIVYTSNSHPSVMCNGVWWTNTLFQDKVTVDHASDKLSVSSNIQIQILVLQTDIYGSTSLLHDNTEMILASYLGRL